MDTLVRGVAIGFAVAAPVGPIGLLCIHRTLRSGFRIGFASGAGAATADALYALLAAFALAAVTSLFALVGKPLHIAGGAAIAIMGVRTILTRHTDSRVVAGADGSTATAFLSTFALTMVNPLTIVSFAAFVSASASAFHGSTVIAFAGGTFIGSLLWWMLLSIGVAFARRHLTDRMRRAIDLFSGVILLFFGFVAFTR